MFYHPKHNALITVSQVTIILLAFIKNTTGKVFAPFTSGLIIKTKYQARKHLLSTMLLVFRLTIFVLVQHYMVCIHIKVQQLYRC